MKKISLTMIATAGLCLVLLSACEFGIYPLLFDGVPVIVKYRIDETSTSYSGSSTVNLQNIPEEIEEEIDSIKVFNITLKIDSTAGTNPSTTVSGSASIDSRTIFTFTNVPLSTFSTERSIFDTALSGVSFIPDGVAYLIGLLNQRPLPATVTFAVSGSASSSPLRFTICIKLYTQVFTSP
ncbi:MAG: hypothetical protein HY707_00145 [Ignavibacteriae bacterium]|nr:hypothetical protein [Ignavibacteriota bacterium]